MSTCQIDKDTDVVPHQEWPLSSVMPPLAPLPTAPACARAFVTMTLALWDMASLADSAGLVVSELVTNAVYASSPYRRDATPVRGPCGPDVLRKNDADSRHGGPPADGEAAIRLTLISVRRPATGYPPAPRRVRKD
jgi:hypothetical protein